MAVTLPVPETISQLWVVLHEGPSPSVADCREWVDEWVSDRVRGPLSPHLPRFLTDFLRLEGVAIEEVPCPPLSMLRYLGLGPEEEVLLQRARRAIVVSGVDVPAPPRAGYWAGLCASRALALASGGIVLDPDQRRIRPLAEYTEAPPLHGRLQIQRHILVPTSCCANGTYWVTSLGMDRLGLPNLQISEVPRLLVPEAQRLLNTVAQALVEGLEAHALAQLSMELDVLEVSASAMGRALDLPVRASGSAHVGLRLEEKEGREPMIRLQPPPRGPFAGTVGEWLRAAVDALELARAR